MEKTKALFLDRDGVINEDYGYVHKIEDFKFRDGIENMCKYFQHMGFKIVVITNQSGISKGIFTERDFQALTDYMVGELRKRGVSVLDVFHCPDSDDLSPMRKPNPGMFLEAITKHGIDAKNSINIGDRPRDLIAGHNAGIMSNVDVKIILPLFSKTNKLA